MNSVEATATAGEYQTLTAEPRAPMTLRIGVAGHRGLPESRFDGIRGQLIDCYGFIHSAVEEAGKTAVAQHIYAPDRPAVFRILSSLAEGADRLCVDTELIPFDHELAAILPFPVEDYEDDFKPDASVANPGVGSTDEFRQLLQRTGYGSANAQVVELDGDRACSTEAYDACGDLLVEHSDLLIVVYDGSHEEDHGSSYTVDRALGSGVPVIHVSSTGQPAALYPAGTGSRNGALAVTAETVRAEVRRLLLFEDVLRGVDGSAGQPAEALKQFAHYADDDKLVCTPDPQPDFDVPGPVTLAKAHRSVLAKAFNLFKTCVAGRAAARLTDTNKRRAAADRDDAEAVHAVRLTKSPTRIHAAFLRADHLARHYANTHRSIFLLIYCLGSLALIAAVLSLALKSYAPAAVPYLVAAELVLLLAIFTLYRRDHRNNFHGKWLDYRYLAETLRPMMYLALLGRSYRPGRASDGDLPGVELPHGEETAERNWVYVYTETISRWAGFGSSRLTVDNKDRLIRFIASKWIDGQIAYHENNVALTRVLGRRLGTWSKTLFFITIAAVVLKLLDIGTSAVLDTYIPGAALLLGLVAAICPILATAAFAIRNHAEFDISAQRSQTAGAALRVGAGTFASMKGGAKSADIAAQLAKVAAITSRETAGWLDIYEVKETEPA